MAQVRTIPPVLLVVAVFTRHPSALTWGLERLQEHLGPIALQGEPYLFTQTTYYERTMGADLNKQLIAFRDLVSPDSLPRIKLLTNRLEEELAQTGTYPETRPLNLDPGLLTLGKFMLATTKDQAHRIYLGQGIFAEVTLRYQDGAFVPWEWTYADYRQPCVHAFLLQARSYYRQRLAEGSA